ncbi:MAG: hypothetical protein ACI4UL_06015 [Muribaculaceae bacterium]
MDNSLEQLLKQVLELEGLILVAQKRGDETPSMVYQLIGEKAAEIGTFAPASAPVAKPADENAIDALPDDDITVEFVDEDSAESAEEPETAAEPQPEPEQPDEVEVEAEPEEEIVVVEPIVEETPEEEIAADADETAAEEEITVEEDPAEEISEEDDEDVSVEADEEIADDAEPITADDFENDEEDEEAMRLDEALQRNMSKDLRHAFSLNDRYRYRRELFGNSDSVMNDTLNLIDSMSTFDEAEDYFYNDLEWEHDSPEVADFMVIIKNHFWNKRQQL